MPALPWKCDDLVPDLCQDLVVSEGYVRIRGVDVRYWKYERESQTDDKNSNDSFVASIGAPIIAIHGGPGWPHNYMLPLKQQACRGRPVYFYDQAGCGESFLPKNASVVDEYPWLLTIEYYSLVELPTLIEHWGLQEYHIIGNSWGTVLSQMFVLDSDDSAKAGLQSMVLSGPFSQAKLYIDSQWSQEDGTIGSLPLFVQDRIRFLENKEDYDSEEYKEIADLLTTKFTCRTAPLPDCFLHSSTKSNEEIYVAMQGASEFTIAGTLGTLNITHRLVEIDVPVLLTHGKYDTMRPAVVEAMKEKLPCAESVFLHKSGHVSMIDEPKVMNDAIAEFFDRVEHDLSCARKDGRLVVLTTEWSQVTIAVFSLALAFLVGLMLGRRTQLQSHRKDYVRIL